MKQFKGWTLPGPVIDWEGLQAQSIGVEPHETLDVLSGYARIFQNKKGHRYSTDDLLAAWWGAVSAPSPHRILDLGSGLGTVAQILAWKFNGAKVVTIEAQAESVVLAQKTAKLNQTENRVQIFEGDFRDDELWKLHPEWTAAFDLITGTPPYFGVEAGVLADHPQKVQCRFETRGGVEAYCIAAARALAPGGVFVFVVPYRDLDRSQKGCEAAGLKLVRVRPVEFKEGEPPLLGLFLAMKKSDLPEISLYEDPTLVIRLRGGAVSPEYIRIKLSLGFPP